MVSSMVVFPGVVLPRSLMAALRSAVVVVGVVDAAFSETDIAYSAKYWSKSENEESVRTGRLM